MKFTIDTSEQIKFQETDFYFFVNFVHRGDQIAILKPENFLFDLKSHLKRTQESDLAAIMKKDTGIQRKNLDEAIGEYLTHYGYSKTYNKMMRYHYRPEDTCMQAKIQVKQQLISNNFDLALRTLKQHKRYVRSPTKVMKLIRTAKLIKLIRQRAEKQKLVKYMTEEMKQYKDEKFEVIEKGTCSRIEIPFKVTLF